METVEEIINERHLEVREKYLAHLRRVYRQMKNHEWTPKEIVQELNEQIFLVACEVQNYKDKYHKNYYRKRA